MHGVGHLQGNPLRCGGKPVTVNSHRTKGSLGEMSLVTQMVKNLPAMQETWVGSLGQEDPLQKGMATHSSILAWSKTHTT